MATSAALSAPLLSLANITKRFGGTLALESIDWSVAPGEVHCLVGENGSGKSTLIKILSGVHAPDAGGEIKMGGVAHPNLTPHQARQLGIQVIFQDLSLFPNLTVEENIAIGLELSAPFKPPPRKAMRDAAKAALARLDAELPLDAPVGRLPVAQRQIVAICRGLAANARILFMDEPTASLTRHEVDLLLATVRRLKEQGVSIVFVSHRLDEVVEIAERVTVLRDGRKVGTFPAAEIDDNRLSELMTGESLEHTLSARPTSGRRRVLEVKRREPRRRIRGRLLHHPRRRDPRPHRPARRRPHRAGAGAVRHVASGQRRGRRRWQAAHVLVEQGGDRGWHRLCLGGPPVARDQPAPVDRRQHRDHRP